MSTNTFVINRQSLN